MMEHIGHLETLLQSAKLELQKFNDKKTSSSATKTRAHLLKIKKMVDVLRKEILVESKKNKSVKSGKVEDSSVSPEEKQSEEDEAPVKKTKKKKAV
jgi:hypothetical protein